MKERKSEREMWQLPHLIICLEGMFDEAAAAAASAAVASFLHQPTSAKSARLK